MNKAENFVAQLRINKIINNAIGGLTAAIITAKSMNLKENINVFFEEEVNADAMGLIAKEFSQTILYVREEVKKIILNGIENISQNKT